MAVSIPIPTDAPAGAVWSLPRRIAFRFAFFYVVLFAAPFPFYADPVTPALSPLLDPILLHLGTVLAWFGRIAFGIQNLPPNINGGTGDSLSDWVSLALRVVLATAGAAVWSGFAERRGTARHPMAAGALQIYLRYYLAFQMLEYGLAKVLPSQFGVPGNASIVAPVGDLTPMHLLWTFMSYSPGYTMFGGSIEVLGAILLLFRRTTTVGALVLVAAMANVLALNVFYDVVVKLGALHYLLFAIALAAVDGKRLLAFLRGRAVDPVVLVPRTRATRIAKAVVVAGMLAGALIPDWQQYESIASPAAPFVGIYSVEGDAFVRRMGIDNDFVWVVPAEGPANRIRADLSKPSTIVLRPKGKPEESLGVQPLGVGTWQLSGTLDGRPVTLRLSPLPTPLLQNGIHWVRR